MTKQYVLKPGVVFSESNDSDYIHMYPYSVASMRADIPKSIFEQSFVEFNVDNLKQQIAAILHDVWENGTEPEEATDSIVGLITGANHD